MDAETRENHDLIQPNPHQIVFGLMLGCFASGGFVHLSAETGQNLADLEPHALKSILLFVAAFPVLSGVIYQFFSRRRDKYRWLLTGMRVGFLIFAAASIYISYTLAFVPK